MDGYLLVNKPTGISSFGVVARIRRILSDELGQKVKVGHTGTLDPEAEGLMILVIGTYCRRASEFSKLDKTYKVELILGMTSTTGDKEGEISKSSTRRPDQVEVDKVLNKFIGDIWQTPPAYSAVKIDGQRAYKLARAGKKVTIEPRKIYIESIGDASYNYPKISFLTEVSSGTYIRSLVSDIGQELGTGAYMSALVRTKIDNYDLGKAVSLEGLGFKTIQDSLKQLPSHP